MVNVQIGELGFVGNMSKEFLDRYSEIKGEIDALREQNKAYLLQKSLQEAKTESDEILRQAIKNILREIENKLNTKMRVINDYLFSTPRKCHIFSLESMTDTNLKLLMILELDQISRA